MQQVELAARQFEAGARFVFPAGAVAAAQYDNGYITFLCVFDRFVDFTLFFACQRVTDQLRFRPIGVYQVATFGKEHFRTRFYLILNTFQYGCHLYGKRAVVCQSVCLFIGIRAAYGDLGNAVNV